MKIMIAVPMLDDVPTEFMLSLMKLKLPERNTLIPNARNNLFFKATENGYDWIFWLDSDMVFEPDTLLKLIETANEGHDFVSALTFSRKFPTTPTICKELHWSVNDDGSIDHGCEYYTDYPKDSVFPVAAAGCACLLMKTELAAKAALKFWKPPFEPLTCVGEDYSFCWRLAQMGEEMVCDSRVKVGHIGKFIYDETVYEQQGDRK